MQLISCPACDNNCSPYAETCPQCGHPFKKPADSINHDLCYECNKIATQACDDCQKLSCPTHLELHTSKRGSYRLCTECGEEHGGYRVIRIAIIFIILIIVSVLSDESNFIFSSILIR